MGVARAGMVYLLIAMGIAAAAMIIQEYRFGVADQAQYLTQVVAVEDGAALAGDPYLEAFPALRSVFWSAISAISTEATRPLVCLVVMFGITVVNVLLLMGIGGRLTTESTENTEEGRGGGFKAEGKEAEVGGRSRRRGVVWAMVLPALLLVVPKEQNWFGLVSVSDLELTATVAALPCVFSAMLLWMRGTWRGWAALVPCVVAVPIHGQTGAYLLAAWWVAMVMMSWRRRSAMFALAVVALLGGWALMLERGASAMSAEGIAAYRAIGEALYPELINPLNGPLRSWFAVGVLVGIGGLALMAMRRNTSAGCRPVGPLAVWFTAGLVFPAIGLGLLALDVQEPVLWKLMVGRSFMLPQIAAVVLLAAWWLGQVRDGAAPAWQRAAATVALGIVVVWPFAWVGTAVSVTLVVFVLSVLAWSAWGSTMLAPLWFGRVTHPPTPSLKGGGVGVAMCGALVVAMAGQKLAVRELPWVASSADAAWVDAQRWAREHVADGERVVTPPYLSGWRIGARRATTGELMDGGLLFYAGEPAIAWAARMEMLGMAPPYRWDDTGAAEVIDRDRGSFAAIMAARGDAVCDELGARYAVTEQEQPVCGGLAVYRNAGFTVWDTQSTWLARR